MKKGTLGLLALSLLVGSVAIGANRLPDLTVSGAITATGGVVGDVTGNVTGDVTGDVTGNHISGGANPSSSGVVRIENNACTSWRNAANDGDVCLRVNSSDELEFDGAVLATDAAKQDADADLDGLSGLSTTGVLSRTGAGTYSTRTVTGTADEISVADGDGVSGNPTIGLADDPVLPGTGAVTVPAGTEAQRPGTPAAGMFRYNSDITSFEGYDGTDWGPLGGGGSGSGGINYESDPYFQLGEGDWALHGDTTDLDGGTTTGVTFTTDTDETQIFSGDFKGVGILSKDAADRDGVGVVKTYTIPKASRDQGQVYVSGWYSSTTGLATGDIVIAAYDVTNTRLLTIYGITDQEMGGVSAGGVKRFTARIPISSNTASLRLSFYWNDGTTDAKDFYFAGLKIGPDELIDVPVNAVLDSYTPTLSNSTNVSVNTAKAWRLGEHIMVRGDLEWSGNGAGTTFTVSLPPGLTFGSAADKTNEIHGGARWFDSSGTETRVMSVHYASSTTVRFFVHTVGSAVAGTSFASGDGLNFWFMAPIAEWANSSALMSTSALMNQSSGVEAYLSGAANHTSSGNWVQVSLDAEASDDAGEFSGGTFTAKESGYRVISGQVGFSALSSTVVIGSRIKVNSTVVIQTTTVWDGATTGIARIPNPSKRVWLDVGDTVTLEAFQSESASEAYLTGRENTFLSIQREPNFTVYGAYADKVSARYTHSSTTSMNAASPFVYSTKVYDTHGAYNNSTGVFTAPHPGKYRVKASISLASVSLSAGNSITVTIQKNGTDYSANFFRVAATLSNTWTHQWEDTVELNAGDTIEIDTAASQTASTINNALYNVLTIEEI